VTTAMTAANVDARCESVIAVTMNVAPVGVMTRPAWAAARHPPGRVALALDMLAAAERHGIRRADLDAVMSLGVSALDTVLACDRRRSSE
jgi:hypothetical protein